VRRHLGRPADEQRVEIGGGVRHLVAVIPEQRMPRAIIRDPLDQDVAVDWRRVQPIVAHRNGVQIVQGGGGRARAFNRDDL
jgi:hypothetical protein